MSSVAYPSSTHMMIIAGTSGEVTALNDFEETSSTHESRPMLSMQAVSQATEGSQGSVITSEGAARDKASRGRHKPLIQGVNNLLRNKHGDSLFEPMVVAIGPLHEGKDTVGGMEDYKRAAAHDFVAGTDYPIELFYNRVRDVARTAKECYASLPRDITEEEFVTMMFVDGCFILQIIDLLLKGNSADMTVPAHFLGPILKDMFLLENQLPFVVLNALMSLKFVDLDKFMRELALSYAKKNKNCAPSVADEPIHLLDLLRIEILGKPQLQPPCAPVVMSPGVINGQTLLSVLELEEMGIFFKKRETGQLRDIKFRSGLLKGLIFVPAIIVDDLTKSRFLNMIAYEMCPDSWSDYGISCYVWMMHQFLAAPGDVKKLQSKGILLNALGSNEEVIRLFQEIGSDMIPIHLPYSTFLRRIGSHLMNPFRSWCRRHRNSCLVALLQALVAINNAANA